MTCSDEPRSTLRGVVVRSRMASTQVGTDKQGRPVYADDQSLGNRTARRALLREQREAIAARNT